MSIPPSKSLAYRLVLAALFLLLILLMQPLEVWLFLKDIPVLFPKGIIGIKQRDLLLLIQAVMLIFVIPVFILTFIFSWRYRADNPKAHYDPHLVDHKVAEYIWWGVPFVFTIAIAIVTYIKTHELDPYRPIESDKEPIEIEVVALQWKWLFLYPKEQIATVNFIQIPTETPVHFRITADAPMNSFWIPRLGGQIYAMAGMTTQLYLMADEEGDFRGSSAQISGKGFSGMTFTTRASSQEAYEDWVVMAQASSSSLDWSSYTSLVKPTENVSPMFFKLEEPKLFDKILMKFMSPDMNGMTMGGM